MMTNLLNGAHVANKLFSTIARLRLLLVMLVALSVSAEVWGAEGDVAYTLSCVKNTSNTGYANYYEVTINSKKWNAPGNQAVGAYWRIGGKGLTKVNRMITGKNTIDKPIQKITVNHNGKSNNSLTVHSFTITVATDANFSKIVETKQYTPSISTNTKGSFDLTPNASIWASGCYYKFTINVSNSNNSSNYGFDLTSIVFYEGVETVSCNNEVKVTKGTPSNGSFSISKTGTYETCDAPLVITLSNITPSTGYQFGAITQTGIGTGVTIDQANKTVTYAKNTSGTSTINVTFEQKQSATIVLSEAGTENTQSGTFYKDDSYTLPSSTNAKCGDKVLVGWSTEEIAETDTKPTYYDKGTSVSLKAGENKFYAVFAIKSETTGGTTTTPTTASLSFASTDQRTSYSTSKQVWEQNGITLTNDKGSSTSNVGDYANPARFYKSSKITLSFTYAMTQIVFICSSSDYATDLKSSIKSGATVTASGSTVTAELTEPATSFVISSLSGQVRMNSVEVTYESSTQGAQNTTYSDYTTSCTTQTSR